VREIEREQERERRERARVERAAALAAEHKREDRTMRRVRARAIYRAPDAEREAVRVAWDRAILGRELEREREHPPVGTDMGRAGPSVQLAKGRRDRA
jgi:hypothetical protein